MISFDEIEKSYGGEPILEGVTFKLNRGEKCGLVGRNGTGKSTLLRMVTKEETPDGGKIEISKHYTIGYLKQHIQFTKPTLLEEAALALPPEEEDCLYKVEKILFGLGFKEEDLDLPPGDFSGGYQLRLHLAKALVAEPHCLLLDEPTNYLDVVSIRWMTRFLRSWQGELILISHDRDFMDSVTTHTLGIHRNKVYKYEGGTEKFYAQLLRDEEIHEKARQTQDKKRAEMEHFIERLGAKASKAAQAQSRVKALAKMPVLEELAKLHQLDFRFPFAPFPGIQQMEVENLFFSYEEKTPLIENLSFTLDKADRLAIIGKNGRGKSTILKLLAQEMQPKSGKIKISSNVKLGYFGQTNIDRLHPQMTIEEEIASVASHLSISEIRKICGVMMFSGTKAKKKIGVLSGGEKSRVLLGKILVSPCNVLLLDEPTNHLDMESIEVLVSALEEFPGSVIIVTHSELLLRSVPTKFVVCHQGNQHLFYGNYEEFLEKEGWEQEEVKKPKKKVVPPPLPSDSVKSKAPSSKEQQKKIAQLEKQILELEIEKEKWVQEVITLSAQGSKGEIIQLSQKIKSIEQKISDLFKELDNLH